MIFAIFLLITIAVGNGFSIRPMKLSSVTLRSQNIDSMKLQMSADDSQPVAVNSENGRLIMVSVATVAITMLPGFAEATDGSMAIAKFISPILDAFIFAMNFLFVCRTVISWYPKTDLTILPFSAIVWPTEPLLVPVRELVPPAFGVDVSAIVWISLLSFLHEILTGQQGILTLLEKT